MSLRAGGRGGGSGKIVEQVKQQHVDGPMRQKHLTTPVHSKTTCATAQIGYVKSRVSVKPYSNELLTSDEKHKSLRCTVRVVREVSRGPWRPLKKFGVVASSYSMSNPLYVNLNQVGSLRLEIM